MGPLSKHFVSSYVYVQVFCSLLALILCLFSLQFAYGQHHFIIIQRITQEEKKKQMSRKILSSREHNFDGEDHVGIKTFILGAL